VKAVVIGATGHIGNAIVRALLDQGIEVTATSRKSVPGYNLAGLPVRFACGDSGTFGQFDQWVFGHDIVVDAAAPYPLSVLRSASKRDSDPVSDAILRTRELLAAVFKYKARLVSVGSFATVTSHRRGFDTVQYEMMRGAHPYFAVKEAIEAETINAARSGIKAVLLNPTMCIGPWDMRQREFCIVPRLLAGEVPTMTNQILNLIDVRDVADATIAALKAEKFGDPIPLSGHNISVDMLFSWICEIGQVRPPRTSIPASLAVAGSYWAELALAVLGQSTPVPSVFLMLASALDCPAPDRRQVELGIAPRPLSGAILDAIDWYRRIGYC
jgi:dihydroflavonol-4-reductase